MNAELFKCFREANQAAIEIIATLDAMEAIVSNDFEPIPDGEAVRIVNAKFPLRWDSEYYAVWLVDERGDIVCPACNGAGKVVLCDGKKYICPNCDETKKEHGVIIKREYRVLEYRLNTVAVYNHGKETSVRFTCAGHEDLFVKSSGLADMSIERTRHKERYSPRYIYNNREEAQLEADRKNNENYPFS